MYTKTITVNTDWLRDIDGMTVAGAIEYLQQLNPTHVLCYSLEGGDTHGVDVSSELSYDVPMTNKEILAQLGRQYTKQIAEREKSKQYYIDKGQFDRLPAIDKMIVDIVQQLHTLAGCHSLRASMKVYGSMLKRTLTGCLQNFHS